MSKERPCDIAKKVRAKKIVAERAARAHNAWQDDAWRAEEIAALRAYMLKPSSVNFETFCGHRTYGMGALHKQADLHEDLNLVFYQAKNLFAGRRDEGCLNKKFDGSYGRATYALFSAQYKTMLEDSKASNTGTTINLIKAEPWVDGLLDYKANQHVDDSDIKLLGDNSL